MIQIDAMSAGVFSGEPDEYLSAFVANSPRLPIAGGGVIYNAFFKSRVGAYLENPDYDGPLRSIFVVDHKPGFAIIVQVITSDETYFALEPTIMRILTTLKFDG